MSYEKKLQHMENQFVKDKDVANLVKKENILEKLNVIIKVMKTVQLHILKNVI